MHLADRNKGIYIPMMLDLNKLSELPLMPPEIRDMLFEDFKDEMVYELRSYKEASFSNTQYYKSAVASPRRDIFKEDFANMSWPDLANKYMQMSSKEKVLYGIKKYAPPICYYMLNYWRNG